MAMSVQNGVSVLKTWIFSRSTWAGLLRWTWRSILALFLMVHLYALILKWVDPPGTILIGQRNLELGETWRNTVKLEDISPHLIRAVIAAEDSGFCAHSGVDFEAMQVAIEEWRAGEGLRGASTITQQAAKNVFFWNGGGAPRKAGDAWMGLVIDKVWGKRRVMETYLNVAEWGDGIFGIEAASRIRFNKTAAQLTRREAALLAAVLPSPNRWRVDPPGPYVSRRAGTLQARMNVVESDGLDACILGLR